MSKSKKEKSRISNIGKKRSIEFSKKISLLKKGFKHTEDSLNKIKGPKRKIEKLKIYVTGADILNDSPKNHKTYRTFVCFVV